MRWPKYWSFSFNISPSSEHPRLISFRMDWLDLLAIQGTLKSLLQHHSSKVSIRVTFYRFCGLWKMHNDIFFAIIILHQFSSVQSLSCVWFLATPWTAACQASLSITNSQSLSKPMSIESVMPSSHLILCHPLLLLPSIRASGSFQVYIIDPNTLYFTCQATFPHHQPIENHWSFYLFPFLDII